MNFYNIHNKRERVSFKTGVLKGSASDQGLFFPEYIPVLPDSFFRRLESMTLPDVATSVLKSFMEDDFSDKDLQDICGSAFNFPIPLNPIDDHLYVLELFHGPSLAFKDIGARFLAEVLKKIAFEQEGSITVLVATSGDTGSAVAKSFYNVEGVDVVLLYPSGKVSPLQEKTLTTMDGNIHALEIDGTFDDCQKLVKTAFSDQDLKAHKNLTSANSINIGRFLPQVVYYFWAWSQIPPEQRENVLFSVPSGNYGNISAGILAYKMGLPVRKFIAAANVNRVFPDYLNTGHYEPRAAIPTLSNAMDVGDPSNFIRVMELFGHSHEQVVHMISGHVASDEETLKAIQELYHQKHYLSDPHGAVGYLGATSTKKIHSASVFLETAHPAKFKDTVESAIHDEIELPPYLKEIQNMPKKAVQLPPDFHSFKNWLLDVK